MGIVTDQTKPHKPPVVSLKDRAAWRAALLALEPRPILTHLNADTTWLLQLPLPASTTTTTTAAASPRPSKTKAAEPRRRTRWYNILVDPWLQGPQSDVAAWFSTQWHVVAPAVQTMRELEEVLAELEEEEGGERRGRERGCSYIDCVAVSHEFTDHCHEATLRELPGSVPVVASEKAAELVRSWNHFDTVVTMPGFSAETLDWRDALVDTRGTVPPWLGIGRVVTRGNALYYHSAVIIAFDLAYDPNQQRSTRSTDAAASKPSKPQAVIYSPHGIKGSDLACVKAAGINTLALLHGLDDVRIWMTAQLNLGALNGIQAVKACGATYWISTHDEAKKGGGVISWLLRRTSYSLKNAVEAEEKKAREREATEGADYDFVELGSGDALVVV